VLRIARPSENFEEWSARRREADSHLFGQGWWRESAATGGVAEPVVRKVQNRGRAQGRIASFPGEGQLRCWSTPQFRGLGVH